MKDGFMINEILINNKIITSKPNYKKILPSIDKKIRCTKCKEYTSVRHLTYLHFKNKYLCLSCSLIGHKTSKTTRNKIAQSVSNYAKNNITIDTKLKRMNKTKEDFVNILNEYKNSLHTLKSISKKYGMSEPTLIEYLKELKLIKPYELREIYFKKSSRHTMSQAEFSLFTILKKLYGTENVTQTKKINQYFYDICLFNNILIEYDGYYWHKIIKNKNDRKKTLLAKKKGFILYRVKEDKKSQINLNKELRKIHKIVKLITN